MAVVGVDGCKGGWFAVRIEGDEGSFRLFPTVTDLVKTWNDVSLILIDIPIGLSSSEKRRACDEEARKRLGPRWRSVFLTLGRTALDEYRRRVDDEEAGLSESESAANCRLCFYTRFERGLDKSVSAANCRQTGEKLSEQALRIVPKIEEVDDYICKRGVNDHPIIREVHPEICWWALNGEKAMENSKKEKDGLEERLRVLSKHYPDARDIYDKAFKQFKGKGVAKDDIVDAMAAAVTADCRPENLRTLPAVPEQDAMGLPMEMVYRAVG